MLEEGSTGKVKLTKHALEYFRDEREDHRAQRLQDFATNPLLFMGLFNQWGSQVPSDTVARSHLKLDRGLSEQSARSALGIFKENITFADVKRDAKVEEINKDKSLPKVGDYVQWTSNGIDQFKPVRKVTKIEADHVWVHGSQTGIPMNEVTVTSAPSVTPVAKLATPGKSEASENEGDGNEISVLLTPQGRLQISADVDDKGLEKLKQMIGKYEEILKLM